MKVRIVERAKKTVGSEISSQMKKGKKHDQAVAIAMSKKERGEIKKEIISENIDEDYLRQQGITLSTKLGEGQFGVVYEIIADLGEGKNRYALKYVSRQSKGYERERANYRNIKKFVELANIRQDAEAMYLSKILPIIYSVSEHRDGLYIIMEKLIPLSESEKEFFMTQVTALAWHYSKMGVSSSGDELINYIKDRDGKIGLTFGADRARAILSVLAKGDEYNHIRGKIDNLVPVVLSRNNSDRHGKIVFDSWKNSGFYDDIKYEAMEVLYDTNKQFKTFLNGVGKILISQYRDVDKPGTAVTNDADFLGMLMNSIFNIVFTHKYPLKYVDNPNTETPFDTGYGESSSIYDLDIQPNPKLKENKRDYSAADVPKNPAQPEATLKKEPAKYPFDNIIDSIRRLGRDWDIKAKDMHNMNVMKRADGQYVIADIGLFNTKTINSIKSGIFESKNRKIKVKII